MAKTGKNKTEIKTKLKEIILGYVEVFPESKDQFFKNNKIYNEQGENKLKKACGIYINH